MARKKSTNDQHGQTDVSGALDELQSGWSEVEEPSFGEVPDGKYQARIDSAVIERAKSSGRLQTTFSLSIIVGDHKGRKLWKRDGMEDESQLQWLRSSLARLGVEWPSTPQELPDIYEELTHSYCQITIRTKGEYQNVYFDKALDSDDVDDELGDEEEHDTEELEAEISIGVDVQVEFDGELYKGIISAIDEDAGTALVVFEDDDKQDVAFEDLIIIEGQVDAGGDEEEEGDEIVVGCTVAVDFDGDTYEGTVQSIGKANAKGQGVLVEFEDGEKETVDIGECEFVAGPEGEEEPEETEETEEEEETGDSEEGVAVEFDDDKLTAANKKAVHALAEAQEFDADEYESLTDLLVDIAEYLEVTGEFGKPADLIKATKAAAE